MRQVLLIDGNSLGWASFYATQLSKGQVPTGLTFTFLNSLRGYLANDYLGAAPIILWDGKAHWRYDRYPDYKGNRQDTPEKEAMHTAYAMQKVDLVEALRQLGVHQMRHPNAEADDLAAPTIRALLQDQRIQLITLLAGDKDWIQLVGPKVVWRDNRTEQQVGLWNFADVTGVDNQEQFIQLKALTGDTSDYIKGAGGIGDELGLALVKEYGSVTEFISTYNNMTVAQQKKVRKAYRNLAENLPNRRGEPTRDVWERNLWLMDIRDETIPTRFNIADRETIAGKKDIDSFYATCQTLGFNSIVEEFDNWIKPFLNQ